MDLQEAVKEIKDRLDIVDLISEYIELKRAGQNFKALCPFHNEKTPSFIVSPEKHIFHCFGCGVGGDVITFVIKYEGLPFIEAVKSLAERAGIKVDEKAPTSTSNKNLRRELLDIHKEASIFFQNELTKNTEARNYLRKRGLSEDIIQEFSIGFAPRKGYNLLNFLRKKGHSNNVINSSGLCKNTEKEEIDIFRNRIIFPIFSTRGDVIAFGGRTITEDSLGPKYLNSPETIIFKKSYELFGLNLAKNEIKNKGYAVIMEGYLDVITAHQYGIKNSVAPLGTSLTEGQAKKLKPLTKKLLLIFDSDEAGIKASQRALSLLYENGFTVKVLFLPKGEDPDSFLRRNGVDAFKGLFKDVKGLVDFYLSLPDEKIETVRGIISIISKVKDGIMRGYLIREVSEKTGLSEQYLREELTVIRKGSIPPPRFESTHPWSAELYLLGLYLSHPEYRDMIRANISLSDIEDKELQEIFSKILSYPKIDLYDINSRFNEQEMSIITSVTLGLNIDRDEIEKSIVDCVKNLKEKQLTKKRKDIEMEIGIAEKKGDHHLMKELQQQLNMLIKGGG